MSEINIGKIHEMLDDLWPHYAELIAVRDAGQAWMEATLDDESTRSSAT